MISPVAATSVAAYLLFVLLAPLQIFAGEYELNELLTKMESDVIELAQEVESVYKTRCSSALEGCSQSNYDSCVSDFSDSVCHQSDEFINPVCSRSADNECASLISYTESTVVLPRAIANGKDGNPTDPQVSLTTTNENFLNPSIVTVANHPAFLCPLSFYFGTGHWECVLFPKSRRLLY